MRDTPAGAGVVVVMWLDLSMWAVMVQGFGFRHDHRLVFVFEFPYDQAWSVVEVVDQEIRVFVALVSGQIVVGIRTLWMPIDNCLDCGSYQRVGC